MTREAMVLGALLLVSAAAVAEQVPAANDGFTPPVGLPEGWYARIETSMGQLLVRMLPEQAPQSVAHFAALAEGRLEWNDPVTGEEQSGPFYDGATIYLSKAGMLFEAGDRTAEGSHAPFLYVPPEGFGPVNFHVGYRMGNVKVGPGHSASRFLITAASNPGLSGTIPCFGVVLKGQEHIFPITAVKTHSNGRPIEPVVIEKVRMFTVGDPAPLEEPKRYFPDTKRVPKITEKP